MAQGRRLAAIRTKFDISYGQHRDQTIDIFEPAKHDAETLLVFIPGGSWKGFNHGAYRAATPSLAKLGYRCALISYRLFPEVRFPVFVEDCADAINFLMKQYQPKSMVIIGFSAGAHIGAMLSLSPKYQRRAGLSPSALKGFVGISGPYDFNPRPDLKPIFADSPKKSWNPVDAVEDPKVPMLLLQGKLDWIVWPQNALSLAQKVNSMSGNAKINLIPYLDHMGMFLPLLPGLGFIAPTRRLIKDFIGSLEL